MMNKNEAIQRGYIKIEILINRAIRKKTAFGLRLRPTAPATFQRKHKLFNNFSTKIKRRLQNFTGRFF